MAVVEAGVTVNEKDGTGAPPIRSGLNVLLLPQPERIANASREAVALSMILRIVSLLSLMVDCQGEIEGAAAAQAGGEAGGGGGAGTVGISQVHGPARRAGAGTQADR